MLRSSGHPIVICGTEISVLCGPARTRREFVTSSVWQSFFPNSFSFGVFCPNKFRSELERPLKKVPERGSGEVPERGSGEVLERGSGEVPERGSGEVPEQGSGARFRRGSGARFRRGSGARRFRRGSESRRFWKGSGARTRSWSEVPERFRRGS